MEPDRTRILTSEDAKKRSEGGDNEEPVAKKHRGSAVLYEGSVVDGWCTKRMRLRPETTLSVVEAVIKTKIIFYKKLNKMVENLNKTSSSPLTFSVAEPTFDDIFAVKFERTDYETDDSFEYSDDDHEYIFGREMLDCNENELKPQAVDAEVQGDVGTTSMESKMTVVDDHNPSPAVETEVDQSILLYNEQVIQPPDKPSADDNSNMSKVEPYPVARLVYSKKGTVWKYDPSTYPKILFFQTQEPYHSKRPQQVPKIQCKTWVINQFNKMGEEIGRLEKKSNYYFESVQNISNFVMSTRDELIEECGGLSGFDRKYLVYRPKPVEHESPESSGSEADNSSVDVRGDYTLFKQSLLSFVQNQKAFYKKHDKYCESVLKIAKRFDKKLDKKKK